MSALSSWVLAAMLHLAPNRDHAALADAIATVIESNSPLFAGDDSKEKTAAFMVAIAYRESTLDMKAVGDKGRAKCAFQLWAAPKEATTDPTLCASIAYDRVKESMRICGSSNYLGVYLAGPKGCKLERAKRMSADRLRIAKDLVARVRAAQALKASEENE